MVNRALKASSISTPAPVGGLNDRDSIASMPPTDALILENWFPSTNSVDVRGGSIQYASGLPSIGESLMAYNSSTSSKLFASASGNIYDVSSGGTIGAAVVSGKLNNRWDYVNFGNNGGHYLVAVNGTDLPMFYNGSTWTPSGTGYASAITDALSILPGATSFTQVSVWMNRLFFVEKNSLRCWYLPAQSIGGAASMLDFSSAAKLGGHLVAMCSVSTTAGVTLGDHLVGITSMGEVFVYSGTDPSSATTFSLVGSYRMGPPIANGSDNQGGRFLAKYGANVVAITQDGFTALQDLISNDVVAQRVTISNKIINTVTNDTSQFINNFGWQCILCSAQNKLIINVPSNVGLTSYQYVMNTITGAWCKFTGWNASCFELWNGLIYALIGNAVYQVDVDNFNDFVTSSYAGTQITATAKTAFQYPGSQGRYKIYTMARAMLYASDAITPIININTNLTDYPVLGSVTIGNGISSYWGSALWGTALWSSENTPSYKWVAVNGEGYSVALKMVITTNNQSCRWQAWDIQFMLGGLL
jgi:hypothetical protein